MDPATLEPRLRTRLGFGLDARLAEMGEEFGGLLDRGTLLLMLADEEGLLPAQSGLADYGVEAPEDLEGRLGRLSPTRTFRRKDGSTGFVCDADLVTAKGPLRVVLWDEAVRGAQGLEGRAVRLTGMVPRERGGARELHSTRGTRVEAA